VFKYLFSLLYVLPEPVRLKTCKFLPEDERHESAGYYWEISAVLESLSSSQIRGSALTVKIKYTQRAGCQVYVVMLFSHSV